METQGQHKENSRFLIQNMLKGLAWLAGIIGIFLFLKFNLGIDFHALIDRYADKPALVFLVFLLSEVIFGIIPPEVFMLWAAGSSHYASYEVLMLLLALISYGSGIFGYFIGRFLRPTRLYSLLHRTFLEKYEDNLRKHGYFLIIVASLTPLPYSAICMLVGAVQYPFKKFLLFAGFRLLRFSLYAWIMLTISNLWFLA